VPAPAEEACHIFGASFREQLQALKILTDVPTDAFLIHQAGCTGWAAGDSRDTASLRLHAPRNVTWAQYRSKIFGTARGTFVALSG
jgi:hypothetical protein